MLENFVETEGTKYAKSKGWLVYKGKTPGRVGALDREHFKQGVCFMIEYKKPGKGKVSPAQRKRAKELIGADICCFCIDNLPKAKKIIDLMEDFFSIRHTQSRKDLMSMLSHTLLESFD